jgi:hypothetical protein
MVIDSVDFARLQDAPPAFERWKMRVVLRTGDYDVRAIPLLVMVGSLNVEMLVPIFGEEGIVAVQGLLTDIPQFGDEVKVGWADGPLLGTGFEFSETLDA